MPLTLSTRQVGDVSIIRCGGRIVAGSETESLRDHVHGLLRDTRDVVIHLNDVFFIDSSGMGMLVRLLASTRRQGGDVKLCQVPAPVLKVFKITNLTKLFDIHESEQDAVSSFYENGTAPQRVSTSGPAVLCVDSSADVLACLREILRSAGYNPVTSSNVHDSLILVRAVRPGLLILGSNLPASPGTRQAFRDVCATIPSLELGDGFSTQDAGHAASELLARIQSCMQSSKVDQAVAGPLSRSLSRQDG